MCGRLRKVKKSFPKQSDTMKEIVSLNNSLSTIRLYTRLQAKDMAKDKSNRYNNYIKSEYIIISSNISKI